MKQRMKTIHCLLAAAVLAGGSPFDAAAKSYSSGGGRSYSSHSSSSHSSSFSSSHSSSHSSSSSGGWGMGGSSTRSSSGGGSKTFSSGSGKSYSSGSNWDDGNRRSYGSGKSYSSGSEHIFKTGSGRGSAGPATGSGSRDSSDSSASRFNFDTAAARARKEEASKAQFSQFNQSHAPPVVPSDAGRSGSGNGSYQAKPPPLPSSRSWSYRPYVYIPDAYALSTRPTRIYNVFNTYTTRPWVSYHDPYSSLFWWWLLDRSLDDRAWWAYNHHYDMDPARYQALLATDQQLETRVAQLEAQQVARDPNYVPGGLDRDLAYSDQYVARSYSNRPTTLGTIAFWAVAIPGAATLCGIFIWLVWFKRWQTST